MYLKQRNGNPDIRTYVNLIKDFYDMKISKSGVHFKKIEVIKIRTILFFNL